MTVCPSIVCHIRVLNQSESRNNFRWTNQCEGAGRVERTRQRQIFNHLKIRYQKTDSNQCILDIKMIPNATALIFFTEYCLKAHLTTETVTNSPVYKCTRTLKTTPTFWQVLHAFKCDFKLKWISKGTRVVQHSNIQHLYFGHAAILSKTSTLKTKCDGV